MSSTNLNVMDDQIEVWRDLLVSLAHVIDKSDYQAILQALRVSEEPGVVHQMILDAMARDASTQGNPGFKFLDKASKGHPFNYASYRDTVTAPRDIKLGGILHSWERAEVKFGGRVKMIGVIRSIDRNVYERIVDTIFERTAHLRR